MGEAFRSSRDVVAFGPFRLFIPQRRVERSGEPPEPVAIGGRALDLLIALTDRAGQVVGRRELIDLVWPDVVVEDSNLRVQMTALRKALGGGADDPQYIVNVPGRGYSFVAPIRRSVSDSAAPARAGSPEPLTPSAPQRLLIGRTQTVAALASQLLSQRFVTIVGPGGIGKTSVAMAVADELRREFGDDGVRFVDLGSLADPADVASAVALALGCFVQGVDSELSILAFLPGKRILIVLDCCEHVIAAVARLTERLFRGAPSAHLLATSREALRAEGENVHLLVPLAAPPDTAPSVAQALASPAVQLFMERAASSGYRAELGAGEAPIVASICRQLDGIALAIEIAASRVGTFGIRGTADLLDSGAGLLLQGRRGASPRHQSLQALLDWSFGLLLADEQKILCRLSVFVGQFTLEAAHAVAGDADSSTQSVAGAIASLVDKSLVQISSAGGSTHYRLLDTTRAYAAARLAEGDEAEAIARRHARYFAALLKAGEAAEAGFYPRNVTAYLPHMGNVRNALEWSFSASGDRAIGVELGARAALLFLEVSLFAECQRWCLRALGALDETDRGTQRELELQEALATSFIYAGGDGEKFRAAIERGLEIAETLQDCRHQLHLLGELNVILSRRGDFSGALAVAERSVAIAKAKGNASDAAAAAWMLGSAYHLTGDQAAALRNCEFGFRLISNAAEAKIGFVGTDYRIRGFVILARALWLNGLADRGRQVARDGIAVADGSGHIAARCVALLYSAPVFLWSGDLEAASHHTEALFEQAEKYSLASFRAGSLSLKGQLMLAHGEIGPGVAQLRDALQAMEDSQHHIMTLATWSALADGLARSARPDDALATIDEALARAETSKEVLWLPDLLRTRGEVLLTLPRPDPAAAEESLLRSIDCAARQSALSWELKAAIPLARLWRDQGRAGQARAMLEDLHGRFTEGFATQNLVAARRLLDELGTAA
ncbi:MAG: winged helix-turn-helix domain-containing protein [Rhizomicrobium sp.]